jgi:hypothetical protein
MVAPIKSEALLPSINEKINPHKTPRGKPFNNKKKTDQGPSIYGKINRYTIPIDAKEVGQIYGKCFSGIGLTSCLPDLSATDDSVIASELPYYRDLPSLYGAAYCLQCCGSSEDNIDHWNLDCELDAKTAASTNLYGYEFKFARRQTLLDTTVISCPLRRTACQYSSS